MNQTAVRPISFVLAASQQGSLIVNRNDHATSGDVTYGVGHQILATGAYDPDEIENIRRILNQCRLLNGGDVVVLDCGANIGVHTVECARYMAGWGKVIAIEAQERIFYALAGNIALNNCQNARAIWAAIGAENGSIEVPDINYDEPASYGSLEIRNTERTENIGQAVSYEKGHTTLARLLTIDSLALDRLNFIKLDIEGMELEALDGARQSIERHKPVMLIEHIKTDLTRLVQFVTHHGYEHFMMGRNLLAIHADQVANFIVQ
jgi:FkbM family methyltransferase